MAALCPALLLWPALAATALLLTLAARAWHTPDRAPQEPT